MNYTKFVRAIDTFTDTPLDRFEAIGSNVIGTISIKRMLLLNLAVSSLQEGEVYCEVGCLQGRSLIAALLSNQQAIAYAVDDFSESNPFGENFDRLFEHISRFGLEERVYFFNQDFESFFKELSSLETEDKIGVYFYDGALDYRSQLLGLLLVKPFLAEQALIIVAGAPWNYARQANKDFLATHPQCQLIYTLQDEQGEYLVLGWNLDVLEEGAATDPVEILDTSDLALQKLRELHLQERTKLVDRVYKSALETYICKNFVKAEQEFKQILYLHDRYAEAWHYLGLTYYMQEQYVPATDAIFYALDLEDCANPDMYYSLGLVLESLGKLAPSANAYEKAIELNPKHVDAHNNLGNLFLRMGDVEQAEATYRRAIEADPSHEGAYLNLGNILMNKQELDEAIALYEKAVELNPCNPDDVFHNLKIAYQAKSDPAKASFYFASSLYYQGKYEEAIESYRGSLAAGLTDPKVYLELAICYRHLSRVEDSIAICKEGIHAYPNVTELYVLLLMMLQGDGKLIEALETAEQAMNVLPESWHIKFECQRILPILYRDVAEIEFYRERFSRELDLLIEAVPLEDPLIQREALKGIKDKTTFYLNYQGKNDFELQKKYGEFISCILEANYPQWQAPRSMPPLSPTGKIRIGYISKHLRNHTIAKLFLGWLRHCDREQFEIYCYYPSEELQPYTHRFSTYSDVFHQLPNDLERTCEQILTDNLHVLIFLDIGMAPITTLVAGLRLAPVQCVTWGHPVTTGLPTVDYFLTSDWMEPENGEEHYTETLIRLPKISISYLKPEIPPLEKSRADFHLREDAIVYLCCQSNFKYLPQFDYIFPAIAQRVDRAQFAFITYRPGCLRQLFEERLQAAFVQYGLDWKDYCTLLPSQNQIDYWHLNCVSDVFLDTFTWSGGNTTLEAIACELPVVTCPGEFMRGRHSYAILKMLDAMDTVAYTEAEYIDIAVRLGLDTEWRQQVTARMKQNHHRLYDDRECVQKLEDFYRRVVHEATS